MTLNLAEFIQVLQVFVQYVFQHQYFNARNRHNWISFYLIKKEIATEIDFIAFANDIDIRMNKTIVNSKEGLKHNGMAI